EGNNAGNAFVSGTKNVAFGEGALQNYVAGSSNTALGFQAGLNLSNGSNNIIFGSNVDAPSNTCNQQLKNGNILFGTGLYNGATLSAAPVQNGLLGIGTSTPGGKLSISLNNLDTTPLAFLVSSSTASATTTLFSITNTGLIRANSSFGSGSL